MAGEIQLNSTTMATESSGTITLSNVNSATNRTNLGLGSMATQNANAVTLTGGSLTGTEIDLKSSGTTIYKSDGTTAVLSESGGVVTLNNGTIGSSVVFPAGHVLQVVHSETSETNTLDSTYTNYYEVPLTLKSNSSDVIVTFTAQYNLGDAMGFGVKIYRKNSSGVTTSDIEVWSKNLSNTTGPFTTYHAGVTNVYGVFSITGKDTLTGLNVGDTIYYGLFARRYQTDDTVYFPAGADENGFFSSLIMEVQK